MAAAPPGLTAALEDRYRLDHELGQGGMATVYLAHDLKHDRDVALKVLRPELAAVLGRERFLTEIRLTAKLDHPHILTLIDSGESHGFLWYVLPYVRGESLRQRLVRESQLGIDEALRIVRAIAGALDYAHRQGIIHRDIKPGNILLQEAEPVLADFGIALAVQEAAGNRLTESGLSLGTPQYMSPEQATGDRRLDARSDVYSLAAVLYELLAGEPPHTGATVQAVIAKLMTTEAVPLRVLRSTVPEAVEAAVAKALAKAPADRYRSAGEFVVALSGPPRKVAVPRVQPRAVLIGVGVVALLTVGIWLAPRMRKPPRIEPTLTQITFAGNAEVPALSPDGKLVVYAEKRCPSLTTCGYSVVIQDLGSGEQRALAEGYSAIVGFSWSADGRFIIFSGQRDSTLGDFLLSTLGGREQYFGCCAGGGGGFLGVSDTVIESPPSNMVLDTSIIDRWFYLRTLDGAKVDSIRIRLPGATMLWPKPSPDGRRLLIWSYGNEDLQRFYLATRGGTITDSVPFLAGSHGLRTQWSGSGDGVLMVVPSESTGGDLRTLLRFRITADGRVRLPPDTLAARLRLPEVNRLTPSSPTGDLAIQLGENVRTVWTLERRSGDLPVPLRSVTSWTLGAAGAEISADGSRIAVRRPVMLGGEQGGQLEIWPFEGDAGSAVGLPVRLGPNGRMNWGNDSRTFYRLLPTAARKGVLELTALDLITGQANLLQTVPESLSGLDLTRRGQVLYRSVGRTDLTPGEWRTLAQQGSPAHVFRFPDSTTDVRSVKPSADGKTLCVLAWKDVRAKRSGQTFRFRFVLDCARSGATAVRVADFEDSDVNFEIIDIAPDATVDVLRIEGASRRWLRLARGQPLRDLGLVAFQGHPSMSEDGRRGVVVEQETRSDVWLLKWPKP